jgi:hypothetical protein
MEGIFHDYYAVALAPAIGALLGIGASVAWRRRGRAITRIVAGSAVAGSAWWATVLLGNSPGWNSWLAPLVMVAGVVAGLGIIALPQLIASTTRGARQLSGAVAAFAAVSMLAVPAFASITTAATPHSGAIPSSQPAASVTVVPNGGGRFGGPSGFGGRPRGFFGNGGNRFGANPFGNGGNPFNGGNPSNGGNGGNGFPGFGRGGFGPGGGGGIGGLLDAGTPNQALVSALQQNAATYRWVAATTGSNNAAGLALASGQSVMAIGGFNGTDPSPTLAEFQSYVAQGLIHYYIGGRDASGFAGAQGGSNTSAEIAAWVQEHFQSTSIGGTTLYDLTSGQTTFGGTSV